ncbi:hypothetical protein BMAPRL20_0722 [Burkholderia mallei PRL-20]|nr:hypothetical protein BMAPRL20_0722 [Burkholderia mallei PRL-20]
MPAGCAGRRGNAESERQGLSRHRAYTVQLPDRRVRPSG